MTRVTFNQRIERWLVDTRTALAPRSPTRPFVTLSYAQSLDGSLAARAGEPLQLSGSAALQVTHQLRSLHDGILVGIGTVLADDPQLTVRHWVGPSPQPIVLDSQLRLPATARLCLHERGCWVLTCRAAAARSTLPCQLLSEADNGAGQVDLSAALLLLKQRGIHSLMVEGGATVLTAFLRARLVDAVVVTIAPRFVGGYRAIGDLAASVPQLPRLIDAESESLAGDVIIRGRVDFDGVDA
ncbi:MAG: hypothetical protein RLZZ169_1371 [Pseudomonadota bacterium]